MGGTLWQRGFMINNKTNRNYLNIFIQFTSEHCFSFTPVAFLNFIVEHQMSSMNENVRAVSNETAEVLVKALMNAFTVLSSNSDGNISQLVFKLLNAFKYLGQTILRGRIEEKDLIGLDIFTPILKCSAIKQKLDIIAIFVAYCSVHKELHPMITGSIISWHSLLPPVHTLPLNIKYTPGFYTIVSQFENFEEVRPELLEYFNFYLGPTLVNLWVPQWLLLAGGPDIKTQLNLSESNLTELVLCEAKLDSYIATSDKGFLNREHEKKQESPLSYFIYKICKRMALFPDWIPNDMHKLALELVMSHGISRVDLDPSGIPFDLQVFMEIIDHPELNYIQEPRLSMLLSLSSRRIRKYPCHILHSTLGSLGSTQSLPAIVNISQFLLSRFLINIGSICQLVNLTQSHLHLQSKDENWYKSKKNTVQIPSWFETSVLPPIPPISRSLFVFENNSLESEHESSSVVGITSLIFESLNTIILFNVDLLRQYRQLNIDPLAINDCDETTSTIQHIAIQQYMELYFIPLMTTLMLSRQLVGKDAKILEENKGRIMSLVLLSSSTKLCEALIQTHGNIALYHLIKFMTRVSGEDLLMQSISIDLLNHLFFHNATNSIKRLCIQNELSKQALFSYIKTWNDGTEKYRSLFQEIFDTDLPDVETVAITLSELVAFLPNHETIKQHETPTKKAGTPPQQKNTPLIKKTAANLTSSRVSTKANKFNPYSATSFIPSSKSYVSQPAACAQDEYTHSSSNNYTRTSTTEAWIPRKENCSSLFDGSSVTINEEENIIESSDNYPFGTPFGAAHHSNFQKSAGSTNATPQTPNMSTSTIFNNPWDGSPSLHSTPNTSKIVNTGKNYILGGHNRFKNNSRAQSIHIDDFKSDQ